jgi:hypothetical protein
MVWAVYVAAVHAATDVWYCWLEDSGLKHGYSSEYVWLCGDQGLEVG